MSNVVPLGKLTSGSLRLVVVPEFETHPYPVNLVLYTSEDSDVGWRMQLSMKSLEELSTSLVLIREQLIELRQEEN